MSCSYNRELERIAARTDVNGCGGDCDNCDSSACCLYSRTASEDYEEDEV